MKSKKGKSLILILIIFLIFIAIILYPKFAKPPISIRAPNEWRGCNLVDTIVGRETVILRYQKEENGTLSGYLHVTNPRYGFSSAHFSQIPMKYKDCTIHELIATVIKQKAGILVQLVQRYLSNTAVSKFSSISIDHDMIVDAQLSEERFKNYLSSDKSLYVLSIYDFAKIAGWLDNSGKTNFGKMKEVFSGAGSNEESLSTQELIFLNALELLIANVVKLGGSCLPVEDTKKMIVGENLLEIECISGNAAVLTAINQEALRNFFVPKLNREGALGTLVSTRNTAMVIFTNFENRNIENASVFQIALPRLPITFKAGKNFSNVEYLYGDPASSFSISPPILDDSTNIAWHITRE